MARLTLTPEGARFLEEWRNELPYIVAHTSGSTGKPKEIRLLKADMRHSARMTNQAFGITDASMLVCPLSANYIAGKMMIVRALEAGCRLVMEPPSNRPLSEDYGRVDLLPIVPSQIDALIANPLVGNVCNLIVGGAPVSPSQEIQLTGLQGLNPYATYGMTETCSHVALRRLGESCFQAMPGVWFSVDSRNCLCVNSNGYSFKSLQTNDIVNLVSTTRFIWRGRYDNVVISGGLKFFPEEIERKIIAALGVTGFFITGRDSAKWGQELVMVIERRAFAAIMQTVRPRNVISPQSIINTQNIISDQGLISPQSIIGAQDDLQNISDFQLMLREILPSVQIPKSIILVDNLPQTSTGKILRKLF